MAAQKWTGYLGLGSNIGDAAGHLRAAVELLEVEGIEVDAVSSNWRSLTGRPLDNALAELGLVSGSSESDQALGLTKPAGHGKALSRMRAPGFCSGNATS